MTLRDERLRTLSSTLLAQLRRGVEKESLRVTRSGRLATTPHPRGLGSALAHPCITTDFSESQLEMITGTHPSATACIDELTRIHQLVYRHIGAELLWCASMPCDLPADDAIPIAQYGTSNPGRMKTVYRLGLSHRYGPRMQMISGIHYNFSLPESAWSALQWHRNEGYFALIRNFRRHSWLLLYLFGASPAVCAGFVEARDHALQALAADTRYAPHATSLRMGPLGYQSKAQGSLGVSYDGLDAYTLALERALTESHPAYEEIGIRDGNDYRQLATTILQIENEFYGTIRPKCPTRSGETALRALRSRGVEYVEVRTIDLDPFSPIGIGVDTIRFLDVFLLYCLLAESPPHTAQELATIAHNQHRVSEAGREPGLMLQTTQRQVPMSQWAMTILEQCKPIAAALDAHAAQGHTHALSAAIASIRDPDILPSARMLKAMAQEHAGSYAAFVLAQSEQHARELLGMRLPAAVRRRHARMAQRSLARQREMEADDVLSFEEFRRDYVSRRS